MIRLTENDENYNMNINEGPIKTTLYQAWRRKMFSDDPKENNRIYNIKRRGYEGREKTVLITI